MKADQSRVLCGIGRLGIRRRNARLSGPRAAGDRVSLLEREPIDWAVESDPTLGIAIAKCATRKHGLLDHQVKHTRMRNLSFGASKDEKMKMLDWKITVIATGSSDRQSGPQGRKRKAHVGRVGLTRKAMNSRTR